DEIKTTSKRMGATQRIITLNSFSLLNECPFILTSDETTSVPTICPINTQVSSATIGIRTELEIKSKKSRNAIPRMLINESGPYPRQDGIPKISKPTDTMIVALRRFQ